MADRKRDKTSNSPGPEKPSRHGTQPDQKPPTRHHPPDDEAGRDRVDESSEESFPASDPPSWTASGKDGQRKP